MHKNYYFKEVKVVYVLNAEYMYVSQECYEFLVQVGIINVCTGFRHRFYIHNRI